MPNNLLKRPSQNGEQSPNNNSKTSKIHKNNGHSQNGNGYIQKCIDQMWEMVRENPPWEHTIEEEPFEVNPEEIARSIRARRLQQAQLENPWNPVVMEDHYTDPEFWKEVNLANQKRREAQEKLETIE